MKYLCFFSEEKGKEQIWEQGRRKDVGRDWEERRVREKGHCDWAGNN